MGMMSFNLTNVGTIRVDGNVLNYDTGHHPHGCFNYDESNITLFTNFNYSKTVTINSIQKAEKNF